MTTNLERYTYAIDPQGDATANKVLRMIGHDKRVLELGCAAGTMTQHIKAQGCQVVAVEIDPELARFASPHCERLILGDLDTLDLAEALGEERFDVIVAADVLEHLKNPWRCLESLRGLLTAEGFVVISVPNIGHCAVASRLLSGRFSYRDKGLLDWTHLRFFTQPDLEAMLLKTGFIPTRWDNYERGATETEFAREWALLPETLRQALGQLPQGEVYQFIVKAHCSDQAGWLANSREQLEQQRLALREAEQRLTAQQESYRALEAQLAESNRDLHEHRRAFAEARTHLENRDRQVAEYNLALSDCQRQLEERSAKLAEIRERLAKLPGEGGDTEERLALLQEENQHLQQRLADAERSLSMRVVNRFRRWRGDR